MEKGRKHELCEHAESAERAPQLRRKGDWGREERVKRRGVRMPTYNFKAISQVRTSLGGKAQRRRRGLAALEELS